MLEPTELQLLQCYLQYAQQMQLRCSALPQGVTQTQIKRYFVNDCTSESYRGVICRALQSCIDENRRDASDQLAESIRQIIMRLEEQL